MALNEQGYIGEWLSLQYAHNYHYTCFQPDWIAYDSVSDSYIVIEAKCKKMFRTTVDGIEFIGTGLPIYQIRTRLQYANRTHQRCKLVVTEPSEIKYAYEHKQPTIFYSAWLDELNKSGDYIDITPKNGESAVRIYNIQLFKKDLIDVDYKKCKFTPENI